MPFDYAGAHNAPNPIRSGNSDEPNPSALALRPKSSPNGKSVITYGKSECYEPSKEKSSMKNNILIDSITQTTVWTSRGISDFSFMTLLTLGDLAAMISFPDT
jgi:hypothetical protein